MERPNFNPTYDELIASLKVRIADLETQNHINGITINKQSQYIDQLEQLVPADKKPKNPEPIPTNLPVHQNKNRNRNKNKKRK